MSMDEHFETRWIEYSAGELAGARRASMEKTEAHNLAQVGKAPRRNETGCRSGQTRTARETGASGATGTFSRAAAREF